MKVFKYASYALVLWLSLMAVSANARHYYRYANPYRYEYTYIPNYSYTYGYPRHYRHYVRHSHVRHSRIHHSYSHKVSHSEPASHEEAPASCGERIVFNCDKHQVSIGDKTSPINCGRSTPISHSGLIGSRGHAAGSVYRSMRGAPIVDIGLDNLNVVVHMLPPHNGHTPAGYNTSKRGTGCINVSPVILRKLGECKGTPYTLVYESKFDNNTRIARKRHHYAYAPEAEAAE